MQLTENKIQRVRPADSYRNRVAAIKNSLPLNYRKILFSNHPEYETAKGKALISQVLALNTTDILLTEILERIASGELKLKAA